jgi:diguanylate cyclase (GGDEF)-like protein
MAFVRNNIWAAFSLIAAFWLVIGLSLLNNTYKNLYDELILEQTSLSKLTASTLQGKLQQYETILKVLSTELAVFDEVPPKQQVDRILKNAIETDDCLLDFVVLTPDGKVYASNTANDALDSINLLTNPYTQETFSRTIASHSMVIGRTYYREHLDQLILPIRMAVRNEKGDVIFIVSSVLNFDKFFEFVVEQEKEWQFFDSYIFRDADRYFQLAPISLRSNRQIYSFQVPQQDIDSSIAQFEANGAKSYLTVKNSGDVLVNHLNQDENQSISTSIFLNEYDLWFSTEITIDHIHLQTLEKTYLPLLILVIALFIIYWLFRSIEKNESSKRSALRKQAEIDYLTQLHNRFYLQRRLKSMPKSTHFAMLLIDVDKFKIINDNYGHVTGDKVLKEYSIRLISIFNNDEIIVRYSSDEFIVISFETDLAKLKALVKSAQQKLSTKLSIQHYHFKLSSSIGVAFYPGSGTTLDQVRNYAEMALFQSKKQRSKITYFDTSIKHTYVRASKIEYELRSALEKNEFYLAYQPQLNSDGTLFGVEALLRWSNPKLGNVSPDKFIAIAEATGEITEIGQLVLHDAITRIVDLNRQLHLKVRLAINVSVKQLQQPAFYSELLSTIEQFPDFSYDQLTIEVTENVFIEDVSEITTMLNRLSSTGIKISLDDFGTGYSSLSLLRNLPIDELKIDKSFIDDILVNQRAYMMLEGIVSIADKLNLVTVAEGVESVEQYQALQQLGCNIFQGYYFSKPLTHEELVKFVQDKDIGVRTPLAG